VQLLVFFLRYCFINASLDILFLGGLLGQNIYGRLEFSLCMVKSQERKAENMPSGFFLLIFSKEKMKFVISERERKEQNEGVYIRDAR
jgi:hypothetical protein